MNKKEKWFYVVSGFVATMVVTVIISLVLVLTGVVTIPRAILKISSAGAVKSYDGQPLTATGYTLSDGDLKEGHLIEVITYGKQTEVGESDNHFTVVIKDSEGKIVTSEYQIIKNCGKLIVYAN